MKTLLLIRHAKSDLSDNSLDDHERILNDKGIKACKLIANWISEIDLNVDQVITSSALRAKSTSVEIFSNKNIIVEPELYLSSKEVLLKLVQNVDNAVNVLAVVAHVPGVKEFLNLICKGSRPDLKKVFKEKFPTAGVAVVYFTLSNWNEVSPKSGNLDAFISPRLLL